MKLFISKIVYQVIVGLFVVTMWDVDIDGIGWCRWMIGWVVGITLLVDGWQCIKTKIFNT